MWGVWVIGSVLLLVSVIRWFEQTAEAVDNGWWMKLGLLLVMPFAVWFFPSRVSAGRGFPVPLHEPVRGFGKLPRSGKNALSDDQPPPGTPVEFLGIPSVPTARKLNRGTTDPEKVAKLKEKMREQGMLPPEES